MSTQDTKSQLPPSLAELDNGWKEVMQAAEKYGFILQAYGGVATLATHKNQWEQFGEERHLKQLRVQGKCLQSLSLPCPYECRNCYINRKRSEHG